MSTRLRKQDGWREAMIGSTKVFDLAVAGTIGPEDPAELGSISGERVLLRPRA